MTPRAQRLTSGFTLIELLIVVVIISLLTVAALPTVIAALSEREILDASSLLQTSLLAARDKAARDGRAYGIRLQLDPNISYNQAGGLRFVDLNNNSIRDPNEPLSTIAADRFVEITEAPDYSSGRIKYDRITYGTVISGVPFIFYQLVAYEHKFLPPLPSDAGPNMRFDPEYQPTGWYWNVRQGETLRISNAGPRYTIAGPIGQRTDTALATRDFMQTNPERYLNLDWLQGTNRVLSLPANTSVYSSPILPPSYPLPRDYTGTRPQPPYDFVTYQTDPTSAYTLLNINGAATPAVPGTASDYVILLNGRDDDGDGMVDEAFDGIDNDGDGITDPAFNGIDDDGNGFIDDPGELLIGYNPLFPGSGEYEPETFDSTTANRIDATVLPWNRPSYTYSIARRAVVADSAREIMLPSSIVVDLTSMDLPNLNLPQTAFAFANAERSRLPLDRISGTVDILFEPNGQVLENFAGTNVASSYRNMPYYHFWLASKDDIFAPAIPVSPSVHTLPTSLTSTTNGGPLKKERRLLTLFTKTGNTVINSIENFSPTNVELPYLEAQAGTREP